MGKKLKKKTKKKHGRKPSSDRDQHSLRVILDPSIAEEDRVDRISDLPDSILQYIISLLPLESVAHTRLLSTRWRDVWNITSIQHGSQKDLVVALAGLLDPFHWLEPLNHPWKLQFHTEEGYVIFATAGIRNKLHLNFSHEQSYSIQRFSLNLDLSNLNWEIFPWIFTFTFSVRSLYLTSVSHLSKDIVSSLFSNFRSLNTLKIRNCEGLFSIKVSNRSKLRHLSILDCQVESVLIQLFELRSFHYRGKRPCISFMEPDYNFKDIMLDFRQGPECYTAKSHLPLASFLDVKYITLCQWTFEVMIRPGLYSQDPDIRFIFLKELWWIDSTLEEENVNSLISFLEACPRIENIFVTIDPSCYSLKRKGKSPSNVPRSCKQLRHLKMVKMDGFKNEKDEMFLADCIFNIACREPVILATSRNSYTRRLIKISPKKQWKFVEEMDGELLKAKHRHMNI